MENIMFIGFNQDSGKSNEKIKTQNNNILYFHFYFKSTRMFHVWYRHWLSNIQHRPTQRKCSRRQETYWVINLKRNLKKWIIFLF